MPKIKTVDKIKKDKAATRIMLRAPKGMHDILPADQPYWEKVESAARDLARFYGFQRLEPPILEYADVFKKTEEEGNAMVEKEMYTLKTKGGDLLALRPEYTPSNVRAYVEHGLSRLGQPQKLFNFGPLFRHDRPQLGRFRQFTQIGFEVIGGLNDAIYDAMVILMWTKLLKELKLFSEGTVSAVNKADAPGEKGVVLRINSIGCRVCRPNYKKQLYNYYKNRERELCVDCIRQLRTNPLRLLDCKKEECAKLKDRAPNFLDKICVTCSKHFKEVLEYLDELTISYVLDNHLVRGLDYYNRTVFEIFAEGPGKDIGSLAGGGRYDYLAEFLGGHLTPAVGGAGGVERLIAAMKARNIQITAKNPRRVFLVHAGDSAKKKAFKLMRDLMAEGIQVSEALAKESLKAQLKSADKEGVQIALILGQKEIYESSVIVRDMRTGLQESVNLGKIVNEIKKRWRT